MAAGDWTSGAGLGDANIAVARRTIKIALDASVKNGAVMGHPVILALFQADQLLGQLLGELGVSTSFQTFGVGKLASTAEGTEATPTDWTTSNSSTVSPARRAWARDVGDFGVSLQQALLRGDANTVIGLLSLEGVRVWFNDLLNRILALASSASYAIGTTGQALTWEAVNEGVVAFIDRGVTGRGLGFLSAKGVNDLNADSLGLGGAFQFSTEGAAAIMRMGTGAFVGTRNGIDWFMSSELDADGGDTLGLLMTDGAFQSKHQRVPLPPEADTVVDAGWYTVEARRPGGGISRYETVSHNAVGILEQARFAKIVYAT